MLLKSLASGKAWLSGPSENIRDLITPTPIMASCPGRGRSQSKAKGDYQVGTVASQHAFPSQPKRGIKQFPFEHLVS